MKKILKKIKLWIFGLTAVFSLAATTAVIVSHSTKKVDAYSIDWNLKGRKNGFVTQIKGRVGVIYRGLFWYNKHSWSGRSIASSPIEVYGKVNSINHSISVWVNGTYVSIQLGASAGVNNGSFSAGVSLGVTLSPSSNERVYNYSNEKKNYLKVEFAASGYVWSWSSIGWKSTSTFKVNDGLYFVQVDGQTNAVQDSRVHAEGYYKGQEETGVYKYASSLDNGKQRRYKSYNSPEEFIDDVDYY